MEHSRVIPGVFKVLNDKSHIQSHSLYTHRLSVDVIINMLRFTEEPAASILLPYPCIAGGYRLSLTFCCKIKTVLPWFQSKHFGLSSDSQSCIQFAARPGQGDVTLPPVLPPCSVCRLAHLPMPGITPFGSDPNARKGGKCTGFPCCFAPLL